jgi:tRNA(fMet)-specific endonuclease VapC
MIYFLDTNICIYYLNGKYIHIKDRIKNENLNNIKLPIVAVAELYYGAFKSKRQEYNISRIEQFISKFAIVPFTMEAAIFYGQVRAELEKSGKPIGWNDIFIAAVTLAHGATLITHNVNEFSHIEGLAIEDWTVG